MGVEALAYAYVNHLSELRHLLVVMGDSYLHQLRLMAGLNADGIISVDDTSTTTISPNMFRDPEMSYINHAAAVTHAGGKLYVHHSCGHIRNLLDYYAKTDTDAVDSLCIFPTGNVSIAGTKKTSWS